MSVDPSLFERAEFICGYTAAYFGGFQDPVRPPAFHRGFEFFSQCGGVEPAFVIRLLGQGFPLSQPPPPPEPPPMFVVMQSLDPPRRKAQPRKPQPKPNIGLEKALLKKAKMIAVSPWLEEIFRIRTCVEITDLEKIVMRKRVEGYTLGELARRYRTTYSRMHAIEQRTLYKIRRIVSLKERTMPEPEDVQVRLTVV